MIFTPALLRYRREGNPPLEEVTSHNVPLRGWPRGRLEATPESAAFPNGQVYGTMAETAFGPCESSDVVIVCR